MLNSHALGEAQKTYRKFILFNTISFNLMTGNVVNLYALRLGATTELIGILAAMGSLNFFFSFIGRHYIFKMGASRLMGIFWTCRYIMMIPVLFTLFPQVRTIPSLPLVLITLGTLFFNISKGIALSASKPIVGWIARDNERARFSSGNQTMSFVGTTLANLYIAVMLGQESPFSRYIIIIGTGIVSGLLAASFIFHLPEPELSGKKEERIHFMEGVRQGFRKKSFRELMLIMIITNVGSTLTNPFFVVYCKQALHMADQAVVIISTISSLGVLFVAYLSRLLMDRVGSKPLFFTFNLLKVLVLIMAIVTPVGLSFPFLMVYLTVVFLLNRMCFQGILSSSDIYFFVTSTAEERVDLGIVFNLSRGISGLIGSFSGGFLLAFLQGRFLTSVIPFQIYFSVGILFHLTALALIHRLPDVSQFSIRNVLGILISPRDLRAIWYLNRLEQSSSPEEEQLLLTQIRDNRSNLSLEELQNKMESPAMFVRMNAINGLRNFPVNNKTEDLLINQVRHQPFTSGSQAATMLGELHVTKAIPTLREALDSRDYLLKSKASLSLGQLGDRESIPKIEQNLEKSENPRIVLYSARTLELLHSKKSLLLILNRIEKNNPPHINEELILIISGLLDFSEWFYPYFTAYLQEKQEGWNRLKTEGPPGTPLYACLARACREGCQFLDVLKGFIESSPHKHKLKKKDPLLSIAPRIRGIDVKPEIHYLILAWLIYRAGPEGSSRSNRKDPR